MNGELVKPPLSRLISLGILIFQRIPFKCFKSFKLVAVTWSEIKNLSLPMKSNVKLFVYLLFVYTPHQDIPWKLILIAKRIWIHNTTSMLTSLVLYLHQTTAMPLISCHTQTSSQTYEILNVNKYSKVHISRAPNSHIRMQIGENVCAIISKRNFRWCKTLNKELWPNAGITVTQASLSRQNGNSES